MLYKFRTIVLVCLAAMLLTSCSGNSQQNNSVKLTSFSEYQDTLKQLDAQLSESSKPIYGNIERWWDCGSYDIDSYYLKTKNTAPWKLFGYCITSIDSTMQRFRPNNNESFNKYCKDIISSEIERSQSIETSKFITSKVNDAILSGCIMRFVDIANIINKNAELEIAYEPTRRAAEKQQKIEAAKQAIEAAKRAEALKPVDTNSREYITGLTIGNNFSDFSDAGANAEAVCATARDRRIVLSSQGGVGVDPKTASFLNSKDGFQGCIDGFNGVPQD